MAETAWQGPLFSFGQDPFGDSNAALGPSLWYAGDGLLDPRSVYTYLPDQPPHRGIMGFPTCGGIPIIDAVPTVLNASNIAINAAPTSGVALTLTAGAGVTASQVIVNAATGANVTGLLGLDISTTRTFTGTFTNGSVNITFSSARATYGMNLNDQVTLTTSSILPTPFTTATTYYIVAVGATQMMLASQPNGTPISATSGGTGTQTINVTTPGGTAGYYYGSSTTQPSQYVTAVPAQPVIVFGQGGGNGGPVRYWNPAWALSRTLIITNNGNDTGGFYTINGYDIYGFPMTQTITGVSNTTVSSTKAFKYITSIVPSGTINSTTVQVGTNDIFGLPLRTDYVSQLQVYMNNADIAPSAATFVAADIQTALTTSGDVRGTYYSGTASDGTKRMTVVWYPVAGQLQFGQAGIVGQTQT
jgi:hypothetical protein